VSAPAAAKLPPEPPTATIRVLQYNTAGVIRNQTDKDVDPDKWRFVHVLADRIAAERPDVVTLNEVCENQVRRLEKVLAAGSRSYPMTATFFPDKPDKRCPLGPQRTGRGILTAGPSPSVRVVPPPDGAPAGCVQWDHRVPA
jgi:hypothetical protein